MITDPELSDIIDRLAKGCPTQGVTLSPWAEQLQKDARHLLAKVLGLKIAYRSAAERADLYEAQLKLPTR